jgi:RNA polymerase sigma-70 factor (ECF subfamily)
MTPEWPLDRHRVLLRVQAALLRLDPRLQPRFDESDLVQETLLRAHQRREQFRGTSEGEFVRWLQTILANVAADAIDKERADKRDVARDQSLQAVADSSARLEAFLAARQPGPAEEAERHELLLRIATAVDQLPADQRDAFLHHHLLGTPVAEIARALGRTEKAVAGLLYRAGRTLAEFLHDR